MKDPYQVLGVARNATPAELKAAWRRLAKALHPDREGGSAEGMAEVNEAYDTLVDPVKRIRYDQTGEARFDAEKLARNTLASLFDRFLEEARDDQDIVAMARREIDVICANITAERAQLAKRESRLEKRGKRIRVKGGATNIAHVVIERSLAAIRAQLGAMEQDAAAAQAARRMIDEYEYEMPPEPDLWRAQQGRGVSVADVNRANAAYWGNNPPGRGLGGPVMSVVRIALRHGLAGFALDPRSNVHGVPHWVRVWNNARRMARDVPGVGLGDMQVLAWFAFLHDSRRVDDGADPGHGQRAAAYAKRLWEVGQIALDAERMFLLHQALAGHSAGYLVEDPVVLVCWDADRLDLGRVGVNPDPRRMCTRAGAAIAREMARQRLLGRIWEAGAGVVRHARVTAPQYNKRRARP